MSRYQGTLLPSALEDKKVEEETRKAVLDLLKKINEVYAELFPTSGSNTNGSFVKFFDGTMIQYGNVAIATNSITTITFPTTFANTTYSFNAIGGRTAGAFTVISVEVTSASTKTAGSISVATNAVVGAGGTFNYSWIAIGQWE